MFPEHNLGTLKKSNSVLQGIHSCKSMTLHTYHNLTKHIL